MQSRLAALARASATETSAPNASVDPEAAARLRALGYVSSSPQPADTDLLPAAADHIHEWAAFERALTAEAHGRTADALAQIGPLAGIAPESPLFQSTYARLLSAAGKHQQALARYRSIVQRWPRDASLFHELAVAGRKAGNLEEALRADQAALTLMPDFPSARNGLGLTLSDLGRHDEAVSAFADAVARDPTNAPYLTNLGNAYRATNRLDEAGTAYRRALDLDATLSDAANGLGVVLVQQQRPAEAMALFERAIAQDAAFLEPQLNLAIALHESGDRVRAVEQYRRVERLARPGSREHQAARTLRLQLERQ
jgi:Flp pilus assembly protein TadD